MNDVSTGMVHYYAQRAAEYEQIYEKPERQHDIATLKRLCAQGFANQRVLELSCGTGYWTQSIALAATSVLACDINQAVLEIARAKHWHAWDVKFTQADSFHLPHFGRLFSAAFSGFWWSHIPKRAIPSFLAGLHGVLEPGAKMMFIDNRFVQGSSTPISRTDEHGDSFQQRRLANGTTYEVLKNFPSENELRAIVSPSARDIKVTLLDYYWALEYRTR